VRRIHPSAWLFALLSAVLQVLVFPLPDFYWMSWFAVAPLMVGLLRTHAPQALQIDAGSRLVPADPAQGFLLGYACGIVWYGGTCYWVYATMNQYGGLNGFAAAGILLLFCLYLGLYHGAFGLLISLLARRSGVRWPLVCAPFLWVAIELARTRISGFPWNLLGIAQVDHIPLSHIATITGAYGLSFEIMVVNVAMAAAFLVPRSRRNQLLGAALTAAVVLQAGRWLPPTQLPADRVARLVQENIPILQGADWTRDYFEQTVRELVDLSLHAGGSGSLRAQLIVWPESPAPFYGSDPVFRAAISDMARAANAWVLVGNVGSRNANQSSQQTTEIYNSASLVNPAGEWTARYDKIHLVPFGEYLPFKRVFGFAGGLTKEVGDFSAGTSRQPLATADSRLGVFICYESIFPNEVRQLAKNGAQVFVNISNDGWYGDSGAYAQHLKQARMRAVENARWLLRDTNTGVTAAIDPQGRLFQRADRKVRTELDAGYALSNVTTFYTRWGDWFAYLCAIISAAAVIAGLARKTADSE
jgi:apolipoprotein N-acyltransferase